MAHSPPPPPPPPPSDPSDPCDEDRNPDGTVRPLYEQTLQTLGQIDLDALAVSVKRSLADSGVTFGEMAFVVDPVPRLIDGEEWDRLADGLAQRTRALNAFLRDAYGERRIVEAGIVEARTIDDAEGYEPDLAGRIRSPAPPAAIIGFDLVRDPQGAFLVLEDNLRTPSGIAYLAAARAALQATLPAGMPRPRPIDPQIYELLRATLRHAAHPDAGENPVIVLVSDGPDNVAYYEHAHLAQSVGIPLITPSDLESAGDELRARFPDGQTRAIDVVYRRTDEDRVRDEHGEMTTIGALLTPAWLSGRMGLVNAFGNGVADDKLVHSHVEDFVRFYLGEEPLVASVPTRSLDSEQAAADAIEHLTELVVKPRHGHGGTGVTIGSHADAEQLEDTRNELRRHPERYIAQPIVPLSRHPTVIDGELQPRHLDLRPFAFCAGDVTLPPGGLSRVAFDEDEMIVNSSRNGGGKDTWVVDEGHGRSVRRRS